MPRKGMRSLCFQSPRTPSFSISRNSLSTPQRSFSESMIDQTIDRADSIIMKWNPDTSSYARVTSLFYENKREAMQFLKCVNDLQKAMHLLVSEDSASEKLIQAQNLMQIAMKRLQKEFYQILSMNRAHLDPESVSTRSSRTSTRSSISDYDDEGTPDDDEIRAAGDSITELEEVSSIAMADLKSIADCMISSGYTKECIQIYKIIRKSIIDEGIYRLGKSPPPLKMFRVLDMYTAISEYWQDIETIFSFESTSAIRSQALNSLIRLSESVRSLLAGIESSIQKDSSKVLVPGGGVHPLTLNSMDSLTLLADYSNVLTDIFMDWPRPAKSSLPESEFDSPESDDSAESPISLRIAWLILVLLCKLDGKAKYYKSASMSYLFLANNLQHVISRVRTSNLQYMLGEEWITKHNAKVRKFAANYERLAWGQVFASLPENPTAVISPGEAKEYFRKFNSSFEEAYWKQKSCVVPDQKLGDDIKVSIEGKLVPVYREFYNTHRLTAGGERNAMLFVRFGPDDVGNHLSNLFGAGNSKS
ncbi:hypothetical protein SLEP1_g17725 [Rubroshorea leprosula]|uniref:Exocyst subunit Exo70 family protein n=1 Tax=Rubroshorea leprosula TaxID=152421 RepID=A0AAV5IYV1_9ROSI|nr:hypothetical protein SLEP1_g17725 [Rubroshorea leprosula]